MRAQHKVDGGGIGGSLRLTSIAKVDRRRFFGIGASFVRWKDNSAMLSSSHFTHSILMECDLGVTEGVPIDLMIRYDWNEIKNNAVRHMTVTPRCAIYQNP